MVRFSILISVILLITSSCLNLAMDSEHKLNLNGRWEFRMADDSIWHEATVPGTIHTDLYKNVLIGDPFYRTNEKELQWIDKEDWVYRKIFTPNPEIFRNSHIRLSFDGLDTYADVYLNGQLLFEANNMFRSWDSNISGLLKKGEANELIVKFHSPINTLKPEYDKAAFNLPAANDQAEEKLSVYARKAPYHFGWDWGPRFVTSGIWKPVSIISWSGTHQSDIHYRQLHLNDEMAELQYSAHIKADNKGKATLRIVNPENNGQVLLEKEIELIKGDNRISEKFEISNPERWWPNGLGKAYMYTLRSSIKMKNNLDVHTLRIGLREVELVRNKDSIGESFYFKVNGVPVFAKGANYIPQDNFINHVVASEYEHIIQSAKRANMNMLRVWGGGIYELDYFYELCDENGIMVWQDFMFACSMYPGNNEFISNFAQEAHDNVKRLRNHPSIVLWCGNNEIQDAWHRWGWQMRYSDQEKKNIEADYVKIFHKTIPQILAELDPDRPYWPSSPASGPEYGQTSNEQSGDLHYWGVWHGRKPFESYDEVIPRFSSEYGFQAFPSMKTIETFTVKADRKLDSEVMKSHQRHPIGNQLILNYMERYYPVPDDFAGFVYMSQVMQGEGIRYGIEALRRSMPLCMGSLYWQLNDCWPVASWSGIDYYGRWKSLHHQAKEAYEPTLVSISQNEDSVFVSLVSDLQNNIAGELEIELLNFEGENLFKVKMAAEFQGLTAKKVWTYPKDQINGLRGNESNVVLVARFMSQGHQEKNAHHYFARSKDQNLLIPDLIWELEEAEPREILRITSTTLARQVYIQYNGAEEVRFEPNFFDLLPGENKEISIFKRKKDQIDPESIQLLTINQFTSSKSK